MNKDRYKKENFIDIIKKSQNITDAINKLGLKPRGNNYLTIKKYISLYNLDISHFVTITPQVLENLKKNRDSRKLSLKEILVENRVYNTSSLKKRLFENGLKKNECEMCGQNDIWHGKKISLIIDHIDGRHDNNTLDNLRILCPNCNASLETHCGKNKRKKEYICNCGNKMNRSSQNCKMCNDIAKRKIKKRPNIDTLKLEVNNLGYVKTGAKYGVSNVTIKKWIYNAI
jgi:hypothetical protein